MGLWWWWRWRWRWWWSQSTIHQFDVLVSVNPWWGSGASPEDIKAVAALGKYSQEHRFARVFTKLRGMELVDFEKILMLDIDLLVRHGWNTVISFNLVPLVINMTYSWVDSTWFWRTFCQTSPRVPRKHPEALSHLKQGRHVPGEKTSTSCLTSKLQPPWEGERQVGSTQEGGGSSTLISRMGVFICFHMFSWFSWNGGTPKWMVQNGWYIEHPIKMHDLGVSPWLRKPPHVFLFGNRRRCHRWSCFLYGARWQPLVLGPRNRPLETLWKHGNRGNPRTKWRFTGKCWENHH